MSSTSINPSLGMKMTSTAIRTRFSRVPQISTDKFYEHWSKNMSNATSSTEWLLFDVREQAERNISYIKNSVWIDSSKDVKPNIEIVKSAISEIAHKTTSDAPAGKEINVVAYCSIGYRSCDLINHMDQDELSASVPPNTKVNLFNLEGSLFKWANEGRPVVDSNGDLTRFVHPYNKVWGSLLNENLRKSSL